MIGEITWPWQPLSGHHLSEQSEKALEYPGCAMADDCTERWWSTEDQKHVNIDNNET